MPKCHSTFTSNYEVLLTRNERAKEWRRRHPEKAKASWQRSNALRKASGAQWANVIKKRYGLTVERYKEMETAQGSACAVCRADKPSPIHEHWFVDHCHATGSVRGLLCFNCNTAIGKLGDDEAGVLRAVVYLNPEHARIDEHY